MAENNIQVLSPVSDDAAEQLAMAIDSSRTLGAISAIGRLGTGLAAQSFQELETWLADKRYRELGFANEVDFLNSALSPISKNRYFDRKQLLEKEGAQTFDLLNSLRVPISVRKLLSDGSVKVDDNFVEIGEERVDLTDRPRVTELLETLAAKTAEQTRTIERGKKEVAKRKRENAELEEKLARGGFSPVDSAPHSRALVSLLGDFQMLAQEVERIDDDKEKERFRALALEHLAEAKAQLDTAFGFTAPQSAREVTDDDNELADSEG